MEPVVKKEELDPTNLASVIRHFGEQGEDAPALALLAAGADPNTEDSRGMPALHWAALHDRPELVQVLLERGADPKRRNKNGVPPLMQATSAAVARLLLERGADVNASLRIPAGWTPLMSAAIANRADIATVLLEFGANMHHRDSRGRQALHVSARAGKQEVVHLLLERGAYVGLVEAALLGDYSQTRAFLDAGADLQRDEMSKALHRAAEMGYSEIVTLLLDHGAEIDATDFQGCTVLMQSIRYGRIDIVRLLLNRGANPNAMTKRGTTALSICINANARWHCEAAELLLAHGAQLRPWCRDRGAVLVGPSFLGDVAMIELLLRYGADPNEFTNPTPTTRGTVRDSTNALITAVKFEHTDAVQLLLRHGADPLLQNSAGHSALDAARSERPFAPKDAPEILALLEAALSHE